MNTRKLTRTALFAALTAAGAFIRIPLGYSSITLQFLCTAMAGCLLGPAYGARRCMWRWGSSACPSSPRAAGCRT